MRTSTKGNLVVGEQAEFISEDEAYREAGRLVAAFLCDNACQPDARAVAVLAGLLAQDRVMPGSVSKTAYQDVAALCARGERVRDEEWLTLLVAEAEEIVHFYWTSIRELAETMLADGRPCRDNTLDTSLGAVLLEDRPAQAPASIDQPP